MKKGKIVLISLISLFILIIGGLIVYRLFKDENKLTITERNFINDNRSNLIDVNILNNLSVFSSGGKGVYYDFLKDLEQERGLAFNKNIVEETSDNGFAFQKSSTIHEDALMIYMDHYILVGKKEENIIIPSDITGNIGVLTDEAELINKYLSNYSLTVTNYKTRSELEEAFDKDEVNYLFVPCLEFIDTILDKLYYINYHFTDIKDYYYMIKPTDETLNSIVTKYYNVWQKTRFQESFNENEYSIFTSKLKITEKELDTINNHAYEYGFVDNAPYDTKASGTYGGVINIYLDRFSKFSGITINYKEYKNINALKSAIKKGKTDLFVNYNNIENDYNSIPTLSNVEIAAVMNNSDERTLTSLLSLENTPIYVKENSQIGKYLEENGYTTITYKKDKELTKIFANNGIVLMDYLDYLLYAGTNNNVSERFRFTSNITYNFASHNDSMFNRLFSYYISTIDPSEVKYNGLDNYNKTVKSGKLIYRVLKYALGAILIIFVISFLVYRIGRKVHIKKKIKKSDKMKYIDILTSLKNRNYLSENLPTWNQNTIYPQAVIVIDLNGIQDLNDTYGYLEGDKQIQTLANILIKTQLDNTEVMRTDGNEFTIYMVGYSEKQVLSYIKKLNKECKTLPHDRGAAVGFSMINDDVKLIDDAINEATEMMKKNKQLFVKEKKNEEKF